MELRHLRYFVAVAEHENVSRAARKLHVSQPALSRQVRDLEEELGFDLLERGAKSVRLTHAGRLFLTEARSVLERLREGVDRARAATGSAAGVLHVGYAPSPTVQILPRALREFQTVHPRVRVILHDLSAEEMLSRLHGGKLNLALTARPLDRALRNLRFVEIVRYLFCLATHPKHRLARARSVDLRQLLSEPLLGYSREDYPEYRETIEKLYEPAAAAPRFAEEHDSVNSLIAGVEAGRGVAIVPACIGCIAGPRLKLIPLRPAGEPLVVGALLPKRAQPLAEAFLAAAQSISEMTRPSLRVPA